MTALYMFPVCVTWFVISMYSIPKPRYFMIAVLFFPIAFVVVSALQLLGMITYITAATPVGILLFIYMLALIGAVMYAYRRGERNAKPFLIATGFLLASIVGELTLLILPHRTFINIQPFNIGVLIFGSILYSQILTLGVNYLEERGRKEYLQSLAYTDALTGSAIEGRSMKSCSTCEERFRPKDLGVVMFDVNNLKQINDDFGHAEGDFVLKQIGELLSSLYGAFAKLYRIGGDEFALVCEQCSQKKMAEIKRAFNEATTGKPFTLAFGSALSSMDSSDSIDVLFKIADRRMYQHKKMMKYDSHHRSSPIPSSIDMAEGTR